MAAHGHAKTLNDDRIKLGGGARMMMVAGVIAAVVGLALALLPKPGWQRFLYSYLAAYAFVLSLALGALISVLIHHAVRAGWNISVRRTTENIAATLPLLAILSLPILYSVIQNDGQLYPWAMTAPEPAHQERAEESYDVKTLTGADAKGQEHGANVGKVPPTAAEYARQRAEQIKTQKIDPEIAWKRHGALSWYGNGFFFARIILYVLVWTFLSIHYRRQSILQDENGDPEITSRLQGLASVGLVLMALSITFFAFDIFMSLDPRWYSTMFGVYYIAGCFVSGFAFVIVCVFLLQRAGYLHDSISIEHYHDLGKYLFGFTFFYGYIAFSQYMLLWYSSIPEEVTWYSRHGATTLVPTAWSYVIIAILFGKFAIPFLGLVSRHVKRNPYSLFFWAIWCLVFHFVDMYWVVMPQYGGFQPSIVDLGALLLIGGLFVAAIVRNMSAANLRPTHDPRLPDALAFTNI